MTNIFYCPVCGSDNHKNLFEVKLHEAAEYLSNHKRKRKMLMKIISSIWNAESCSFIKCTNCNFSFSMPFKAGTNEFYNVLYDQPTSYPKNKWEYSITKGFIDREISESKLKNPTFLEIGAGSGAFLDLISKDIIPKNNILATEYSAAGIDHMNNKGYRTVNKNLSDLEKTEKNLKFDFIAAFQVLEHLDNIYVFFESINVLLNESGYLFMSVPNPLQREFFDKRKIHMDMPPAHVGRYTIDSFEKICERMKWMLVDYSYEPMSYAQKFRKHLFFLYARNNLSESFESITVNIVKRTARYGLMLFIVFTNIKTFILLSKPRLGTSLWITVKKK